MNERLRVLANPVLLLAHAISALLQPSLAVVPLLLALNGAGEPGPSVWRWLLWCFLTITCTTALPCLAFLALLRLGLISDLNCSDRSERPLAYAPMIACYLLGTEVAHLVEAPHPVVLYLFAGGLCLIVAAYINQRYCKISIHTLSVALLAVAATSAFGPQAAFAFVLLVAVWWARVTLRAHTPGEATAGAVLGVLLGAVVFTFL